MKTNEGNDDSSSNCYEKDPPYKYYSQIAKEFHMRPEIVQNIIEVVIKCKPDELRQRLRDWLELWIEHKRGTASKSEFIIALHLPALYDVIDELCQKSSLSYAS